MTEGKHKDSPGLARGSSAQSPQPPQKMTTSQAQETQVPGHSPPATPTHASSKSLLWRDFASCPDILTHMSPSTWIGSLTPKPVSTSLTAIGQLRALALHQHAPQLCLPSTAPATLSALPNTPTCTSHHQHNTMTNKPAYWWEGRFPWYVPLTVLLLQIFCKKTRRKGATAYLQCQSPHGLAEWDGRLSVAND